MYDDGDDCRRMIHETELSFYSIVRKMKEQINQVVCVPVIPVPPERFFCFSSPSSLAGSSARRVSAANVLLAGPVARLGHFPPVDRTVDPDLAAF